MLKLLVTKTVSYRFGGSTKAESALGVSAAPFRVAFARL